KPAPSKNVTVIHLRCRSALNCDVAPQLAQIAAHFRFFLHIDLWRSHRDDLMLILFTALIILLMVGGTKWILFDQWSRMM
ncbi:cytochrome o ubiquinol/quinol oxidase subunit IV, partial [Salipiger sp. PrR007]|uniref:cytochrome o ubiquinol oxidase subunit IV n=1 Tax=Salipiger sp. PrR007 TaxID=2706884 RepID=UPI00351BC389